MTVLTGKEAVEAVQRRLAAAGLYTGPIDGLWGQESNAALEVGLTPPTAAHEPLVAQLRLHEGERLKPYRDTVGKLTIGVGRNLDDVGISPAESAAMLASDIARTDAALRSKAAWVFVLDPVRRDVLRDMAFNLGVEGLLGFKTTLHLVQAGQFAEAAVQMLRSKWAGQVGQRATTLSKLMRTGERP